MPKKDLPVVYLPFEEPEFKDIWNVWKEYKRVQHSFTYKSPHSEQAVLNKVYRLSRGNVHWAMDIIEEAVANGWAGVFQLKLNGKPIYDYEQYRTYKAEQSGIGVGPTGRPKSILDQNADTLAGEIQKLAVNGYTSTEGAPE